MKRAEKGDALIYAGPPRHGLKPGEKVVVTGSEYKPGVGDIYGIDSKFLAGILIGSCYLEWPDGTPCGKRYWGNEEATG